MSTAHQPVKSRIVSLDQFRGYTVAGMLLVNFIGGFQAVGATWQHHNEYCSYSDTIMPQFFFAVGLLLVDSLPGAERDLPAALTAATIREWKVRKGKLNARIATTDAPAKVRSRFLGAGPRPSPEYP